MNDLKYALRALTKTPVFAGIAIVTLALGIGLNTAMFSLLNAIFLRPLPFPDSASLVRVYRTTPETREGDLSPADYADLRTVESSFGQFAGSSEETVSLAGAGQPALETSSFRVSSNYFGVLGLRPELGRTFQPQEETPGNHRVAVISHDLWKNRFASAADILGKTVRIDGEPHDIIGVLPESADDGRVLRQIGVFRPLSLSAAERASRGGPWIRVIGRRAGEVSEAQGKTIIATIGARLARDQAKDDSGTSWRGVSLRGATGNQSGRIVVYMLLGLSGFVLLIACSNLANFVLARTIGEIAGAFGPLGAGSVAVPIIRCSPWHSRVSCPGGGRRGSRGACRPLVNALVQRSKRGQWRLTHGFSPRLEGPETLRSDPRLPRLLVFGTAPALLIREDERQRHPQERHAGGDDGERPQETQEHARDRAVRDGHDAPGRGRGSSCAARTI